MMGKQRIFSRPLHFKAKLLLYYVLVILLIFSVVGTIVYQYTAATVKEGAQNILLQKSLQIAQQFEFTIMEMESVLNVLASDEEIVGLMPHVNTYTWDRITLENKMLDFSRLRAKFLALSDSLGELYRISIFNVNGDMLSTRLVEALKTDIVRTLGDTGRFEGLPGVNGNIFWGPHYDPWMSVQHIQVFSLARPIQRQGDQIGWIEVQQRVTKLLQISSIQGNNKANVAILDSNGTIVYSTWKLLNKTLLHHYDETCSGDQGVVTAINPISKVGELIAHTATGASGFRVVVIQSERDVDQSLRSLQIAVIVTFLVVLAVSTALFNFFATHIARPLQRLKGEMEGVNIGGLPSRALAERAPSGISEIDALQSSFGEMIQRLDASVQSEVASRSLHLQARLDALQARINPHFLFNMLGVMVSIAEENGDEGVAKMSRSLAAMLRYTTKSSKREATLEQELKHCGDYMYLMGRRFEDRLRYEAEVNPRMMGIRIPQLTLQPLVENAIMHGYTESTQYVMHIRVLGEIEGARWRVRVIDNGNGFDAEKLQAIRRDIAGYAAKLLESSSADDADIGGLGLINTFARLSIFSGGSIRFEIANNEFGGASVSIEGALPGEEA